jgi:hypothetical protein
VYGERCFGTALNEGALNQTRQQQLVPPYDFLQHFAQPAASPQHLAQVAGSLQQEPSQAAAVVVAAGLEQLQVEHPVINSKLVVASIASSNMDFIGSDKTPETTA